MKLTKRQARTRRHLRIRSKLSGTAERPRVAFCRSNRHLSAQVVDDQAHRTLATVTTVAKDHRGKNMCNTGQAEALGKRLGERLKEIGVERVVFDRGGNIYHGVVRAFADGLRAADEQNHFHF